MRLILKSLLLFCLLAVCASQGATEATAQKLTFDNVKKFTSNGSGAIYNGKEIVGYYAMFMVDKKGRKTHEYALKILDADLKAMQTQTIIAPAYSFMIGAAFNGEALCLSILSRKEKELILHSFSAQGDKLGVKKFPISKKSLAYMIQMFGYTEESETYPSFIQAVPSNGFLIYMPEIEGMSSYSYTIHKLANDVSSSKGAWKASAPAGGAKYKMAFNMGVSDDYIFTNVLEKPKLVTSKGMATVLYVHESKTGKQMFKADVSKGRPALSATNAFFDKELGQVTVVGMYYKPDADVMKDLSSGIGVKRYSLDGKLVKGSSISWAKAFTKIGRAKVAHLKKGGSIYVHQAFSRADGSMSIVGEYFDQEISALGTLSAMSGGGAAAKKMVLQDMLVIDLNAELELENAQLFAKPKSDVILPAGSSMLGPGVIAMMMKFQGSFDYRFSQDLPNGQGTVTAYETYERKKKGLGKARQLNFLSYYTENGEYEQNAFPLTSDASYINYSPAKPGYIFINEYFRKGKRVEMRLEPVQ